MRNFFSTSLAVFCFAFAVSLTAQVNTSTVSAEAMAYGRYADIPVNQYTGTGEVTVPLHTATDGPLTLPIFLQYHTGGLPISSPSSSVGLGWNLNAGGMISRTVMGQPDDYGNNGYYHKGSSITSPFNSDQSSWDLEPDIFTYNFAGYSGKFFIDANQVVRTVPQTDIRIEVIESNHSLGLHHFQQIKITTPDGVQYRFGCLDDFSNPAYDYVAYKTDPSPLKDRNGWHLVQIQSADSKHQINIEYQEIGYQYSTQTVCPEEVKYRKNNGSIGTVNSCNGSLSQYYRVRSSLPKRILTTHENVDFIFAAREDLQTINQFPYQPAKRVTGLSIQNGSYCSKWDFLQSYFKNSNSISAVKRLKLDGVQRKSCNNAVFEPAWQFTYSGNSNSDGSRFFPATSDHNIDHWGYYNFVTGAADNNGGDITPPTSIIVGGAYTTYGVANRTSNQTAMLNGMLDKVTYPTGGYLDIDYEANRYQKPVTSTTALDMYTCGNACGVVEQVFTYTSAMINNGRWELCVTQSPGTPSGQNYGRIQVYTLSNTLIAAFEFNSNGSETCLEGGLPIVGYSTGNQPMVVGQTYRMKLSGMNASATFTIEHDNQQTDEICGGLRIKQTKIHDGISTANDIVQYYRYEDKNNPAITSGILYLTPKYGYQLNPYTAVFTAYSMAPLSGFNGNHIGYKRVLLDKNGIGEEEIIYEVENDSPNNILFPNKPPQYRVLEGTPKESKVFAENSTVPISQSTTQRNISDYYLTYGNSTASGYIFAYRFMPVSETGGNPIYKHFSTPYTLRTSVYRPSLVSTTLDGVSTSTAYTYHPNNLLPREVSTQDSNGDTYKTVSTYSSEHTNATIKGKFLAYNMVHLPVTSLQYHNNILIDGGQTDYLFYTSAGLSPSTSTSGRVDVPRPYQQKRFERSWTQSGTVYGSTTTPVAKITFLEYNNDGLLALYEKIGWNTTRISYSNKLPTQKQYRNHTQSYQYFPGSTRLQREVAVDGTSTSYTYDALGRLQTTTDDCLNIVTTYTYHFTTGGTDKNYTEVKTDFPSPSTNSQLDILYNRTYFDGLGRSIQSVARNQGPTNTQDVIIAREYDKFGRVKREYEPFAQLNNTGNFQPPNVSWGYTETTFETSPLSRPLTVTPPSWAPSTLSYGTNSSADKVKIAAGSTNFAAGALIKQAVKDANNNLLIVFTDKLGRKVLSRRAAASGAEATWLDTYYLYDGKSRLSKVVPPGASLSTPNLIFTYLYDGQNQLLEKKVPDREKEQFAYNTKNLLAAQKDGFLTIQNKWYVHKYDDYGREINSGFLGGSLPGDLTNLNPSESLFQTTYGTNLYDRDKVVQAQTKIMDGGGNFLYTYNTFNSCGILIQQQGNNHLQLTPANGETTTYAYDGAQNVTQSVYTHKALALTHTITSTHFIDYAGRSLSNDFKVNTGSTRKLNQFAYDHKGNVATKYQGGTGLSGNLAFLQKIDYSYLPNGMLQGVNLNAAGKLTGTQTYLPANGATATVPNPALPGSSNYDDKDLFQLELYRNAQATGISTATFPARSNGDIVAVSSQVRGRSQQVWAVAYDSYDRMTNTAFYQRDSRTATPALYNNYRESLTYDSRGNIKTLNRDGSESVGANYFKRDFDRLTYLYDNEANNNISNRLIDINENTGGSTTLGYKPGVPNYTYDTNGNLKTDPSKGITITYNHQDLPVSIVWANNQRLNMIYDAGGTLLRRENRSAANALLETTDFIGGIEYKQIGTGSKTLETIHHPEGRIRITASTQEWQYALTDHLGNTRVMYADLNNDGIPAVPSEIIQEEHYYPFGMKMTGPWMGGVAGAKSAYQYNGIEHVDAFDLNVNMAMYRTLDPVVGRWWSVDPMGEKFMGLNPYNSMGNSPINFADPDGAEPITIALGIAAALGAFNGYQIGKAQGASGVGLFGYALGGAAIGAASAGVGSAITTGVGGAITGSLGGLVGSATGGAIGGAFAGGGFASLAGQDPIEGFWKGGVAGFIGGGLGSYIGGGAGSFVGGFAGSSINSSLHGADFGEAIQSGIVGGSVALVSYHLATYLNYQQSSVKSDLSYRQFRAMNVAAQRSFARGREFGGWLTSDGGVEWWNKGQGASVSPTPKPANAFGEFHTHPNQGPGWLESHSPGDIRGSNADRTFSYVIGRQNFYTYRPGAATSQLAGRNYSFNPYMYNNLWWQ